MNNYIDDFENRIVNKEIKIAVIGLGYVGLQLALEFAKKGFNVIGLEIDRDRLAHIKRKESYISDVSSQELKDSLNSGSLRACADFRILKDIDVNIICVPTPLKRKYHPDISYIKRAVKSIAQNLKKGCLIILESTTYPGTTEEIILPMLQERGLKHNQDFYLCFSPERIDPGNKKYPVNKIPKVIGGISRFATRLASSVYKNIIETVVTVSSAKTAEVVKLLENTFRLINIALINELAIMAHKMNIDIWEVIEAASTKPFGFMPFYPGPGVGGHCIGKDPLYLYWRAKRHFGFQSRFIRLASEIINYMPEYIVERIFDILKERHIQLKYAKVLIIGVTYKKDIKDLRKSPSLDIIDILQKRNISVDYFDPLIPYLKLNNINLKSIGLKKKNIKKFDCIVIATDHSNIDYDFILKNSQAIFDTRNVFKNVDALKVVKL